MKMTRWVLCITVLSVILLTGCDGLPRDNGVYWRCEGFASMNDGVDCTLDPEACAFRHYPPSVLDVCANADIDPATVAGKCEEYCDRRNTARHFWDALLTSADVQCHMTATPDPTRDCSRRRSGIFKSLTSPSSTELEDVSYLQGDPRMWTGVIGAVGGRDSPATLRISHHSGSTNLRGNIGVMVGNDGTCPAGSSCPVSISWMDLHADNFTMHRCALCQTFSITQGRINLNAERVEGTIFPDGSVVFPAGAMTLQVNALADGARTSYTASSTSAVIGRYDFTTRLLEFAGGFDAEGASLTFAIHAYVSDNGPVAVITPGSETIECSSTSQLSGYESLDPETSVSSYLWVVDGDLVSRQPLLSIGGTPGTHTVELIVADPNGNEGAARQTFTVIDTTPPTLTPLADVTVSSCATSASTNVIFPTATDGCAGSVTVTGRVVSINGTVVDQVLMPGSTVLPEGQAQLEFAAVDPSGNVATITQFVNIAQTADCCPSGFAALSGSPAADTINGGNSGQCIMGLGGGDTLSGQNACDYLNGGDGNDSVSGNNGEDTLFGGPGADVLSGGNGDDMLFGGSGADSLDGGGGNDRLEPGSGLDVVQGGDGDDVIAILSECAIVSGETIDGGSGDDTLRSPVSLQVLQARGVTVINVEHVVIDTAGVSEVCQ